MQLTQNYFIGIQDVGANNKMSNRALLDALTNTATLHGNLVKQGISHWGDTHFTWMILNWKVDIYARPKDCETILVKTWARDYTKLLAYRDFEVFTNEGTLIAKATSKWAAINLDTGRIERISKELMDPYEPETDHPVFPGFSFEKSSEEDFREENKITFPICKAMIDCNNHVHNTAYLDIALEVLPDEVEETSFQHLEVTYKKEIKPSGKVSVSYGHTKGCHEVHIKNIDETELHCIIKMY